MATRIERAFIQNIYLLHMMATTDTHCREFQVVGTTGNRYIVSIKNSPSCTCPDHVNNHKICKHIYFIMLRVMKVNKIVMNKYTNQELLVLFNNIPNHINSDLLYDDIITDKPKDSKIQQKYDDMCPVCLDDLAHDTPGLDYCKFGCGKSVHTKCFEIWIKSNQYGQHKCLFCRADWTLNDTQPKKPYKPNNYRHHHLDLDFDLDDNYDDGDSDDDSDWGSDDYSSDSYDDDPIGNNNNNIIDDGIKSQLSKLVVAKLKELCRDNNLSTTGNKLTLINRLYEVYK